MAIGRKRKLTPKRMELICDTIIAGNYQEVAARYAGISEAAYYNWLDRGRKELERMELDGDEEPRETELIFVEFLEQIEKALAQSEVRDVALIAKAAERNWQAAAWRLERKFPDRWGRRDRFDVQHGGEVGIGAGIENLAELVTDPEAREIISDLLARIDPGSEDEPGRDRDAGEP